MSTKLRTGASPRLRISSRSWKWPALANSPPRDAAAGRTALSSRSVRSSNPFKSRYTDCSPDRKGTIKFEIQGKIRATWRGEMLSGISPFPFEARSTVKSTSGRARLHWPEPHRGRYPRSVCSNSRVRPTSTLPNSPFTRRCNLARPCNRPLTGNGG